MATETSLLKLTKPAVSEAADISVLNNNFDLIDAFIKGTGLGKNGTAVDTLDDAKTFGLYMSNVGVPPIEGKVWWVCLVMPHNTTATMVQIAYRSTSNPTSFATRRMTDGVWGDWEYINPPMANGVEYRTTERWGALPVYRKRITHVQEQDIGETGKTTDYSIAHGISNLGDVLHCEGMLKVSSGSYRFPYLSSNGAFTLVNSIGNANIVMRMQGAWTATRTWVFDLKYTKA